MIHRAAFACMLYLICTSSQAQQPIDRQIATTLRYNTVYIGSEVNGKDQWGFGFVIGKDLDWYYLVTANHVLRGPMPDPDLKLGKVKIKYFDGLHRKVEAQVLPVSDSALDIAFLRVEIYKGSKFLTSKRLKPELFRWDSLSSEMSLKKNAPVFNIGCSGRWSVSDVPGKVISISENRIDFEELNIQPGCSGGPLVDREGIVGLVLSDDERSSSAIRISPIKKLALENRIPWTIEPRHPEYDLSGNWEYSEQWEQEKMPIIVERNPDDLVRFTFKSGRGDKGAKVIGFAIVEKDKVLAWWNNALWGDSYGVFEFRHDNLLEGLDIDEEDNEQYWMRLTRKSKAPGKSKLSQAGAPAEQSRVSNSSSANSYPTNTLAGCWQWSNGALIKIERDGTLKNGHVPGTWESVSQRKFNISWPPLVDQISLDESELKFTSTLFFGAKLNATKIGKKKGIVGSWEREDGAILTFTEDGKVSADKLRASWIFMQERDFLVSWPVKDSVIISVDGAQLHIANQFGTATAVRSRTCRS